MLVHAGDRRSVPRREGRGQRVALGVVRHDAVDRQVLVRDADPGQLARGARRLGERRRPRPGDEDQPGERSVGEAVDGGAVSRPLLLQTGERPEAGGVALARLEEAAPGAGQLQEADGVAGRRGVEDDVVVGADAARRRSAAP